METPMQQQTTSQPVDVQPPVTSDHRNRGVLSNDNSNSLRSQTAKNGEYLSPDLHYAGTDQNGGHTAAGERLSPGVALRGPVVSANSLSDDDAVLSVNENITDLGQAPGADANWSVTFDKLLELGFDYASVFEVMRNFPGKSLAFYSLKMLEAHRNTLRQLRENSLSKATTPEDASMSKRLREMGFEKKLIRKYLKKYPGEVLEYYLDKLTKHQLPRSFSGSSDESGPFLRPSDSGTGTQSPASSIGSIPETPGGSAANQRPVSDLSLEVFLAATAGQAVPASDDIDNNLQSMANEKESYKFPIQATSEDLPSKDVETTDLDLATDLDFEETLTPTPDNANQTFVKFPDNGSGEGTSLDQSGTKLASDATEGGDSGIVENFVNGSTIPSENVQLNLAETEGLVPSQKDTEYSSSKTTLTASSSSSLSSTTQPKETKVQSEYSVPIFSDVENIYYFEYKHLRQITANFADRNCIASDEECGFGGVYTGVYPYEGPLKGKNLAVKRLKLESKQGEKEYSREKDFAHINYVYLLTPLGVCEVCEDGYQKCLVYVFLPGNDLKKKLKTRDMMNWRNRLRIGAQLANAVLFLQEDGQHRIYHRDIKSANVFLDSQLNARLGDLGFARAYKRHYSSDISQSKIRFSHGYQDPDYLSHGTPTHKTDCYGLGVVFLELLSNVTALEEDDKKRRIHEKWDREGFLKPKNIKGKLSKIMDKRLQWPQDVAHEFAQIIAGCLRKDPDDRLTIQEVSERIMKLYKTKVTTGSLFDAGACRDNKIQSHHCLYCLIQDVAVTPMDCGCRFLCDVCLRQRVEVNKKVICVKHEMDVKPIGGDKEGNIEHQMKDLFAKNEDNSETISLLKKIMDYSKYVGIIVGPFGVTGTCFRLGKEFVMTNQHVIDAILISAGNDIKVLGDNNQTRVSFHFEDLYNQHSTAWLALVPKIEWSNKELDVAILRLQTVLDSAPRWQIAATSDYVHIIGHNNGDIKKLDYRCPLKSMDDTDVKEILTNGQIALGMPAYHGVDDPKRCLLQASFMHGASGSPCFDKYSRLALLFTQGYPNNGRSGMNKIAKMEIEQGVRMTCIYEALAVEKSDLAKQLFDFQSTDNSMEEG